MRLPPRLYRLPLSRQLVPFYLHVLVLLDLMTRFKCYKQVVVPQPVSSAGYFCLSIDGREIPVNTLLRLLCIEAA